jgi:hypothetical protein
MTYPSMLVQVPGPRKPPLLGLQAFRLAYRDVVSRGDEKKKPPEKCSVEEDRQACPFTADTTCHRCHQPICHHHTTYVSGVFVLTQKRYPYCHQCYEEHYLFLIL